MADSVDFQDEEQVKSFLENMEVECNYQCYHENDPDGERRRHGLGTRGGAGEWSRALTGHVGALACTPRLWDPGGFGSAGRAQGGPVNLQIRFPALQES